MKIRNGFVSNSSSSSFVVFFDRKGYDTIKEELHPYMRHITDNLRTDEVFGQEVYLDFGEHFTDEINHIEGYKGVTALDDNFNEVIFDPNDYESWWNLADPMKIYAKLEEIMQERGYDAYFNEE